MDRGYIHFKRLYRFVEAQSFFVIRSKRKMCFQPLRANIAETLSPALITEQGENGNQREYESEAQWIRRGGCGLARRGTERG
jgi:hypothetical protein